MDREIKYNFEVSTLSLKKLESISEELKKDVIKEFEAQTDNLSQIWQGEATLLFKRKCVDMCNKLRKVNAELESETEQIKRITRHMYLLEKEANQIINNKN